MITDEQRKAWDIKPLPEIPNEQREEMCNAWDRLQDAAYEVIKQAERHKAGILYYPYQYLSHDTDVALYALREALSEVNQQMGPIKLVDDDMNLVEVPRTP